MNKLVSVSAKGARTVAKNFRDAVVADVNAKGLVVGETALAVTPNGEFAVKVGTCPETGLDVFVKFGKPVVTANDPFVAKATPAKEDTDTKPAVTVSL